MTVESVAEASSKNGALKEMWKIRFHDGGCPTLFFTVSKKQPTPSEVGCFLFLGRWGNFNYIDLIGVVCFPFWVFWKGDLSRMNIDFLRVKML